MPSTAIFADRKIHVIRVFNDIDVNKDENLFYVALTRDKTHIYLDN